MPYHVKESADMTAFSRLVDFQENSAYEVSRRDYARQHGEPETTRFHDRAVRGHRKDGGTSH